MGVSQLSEIGEHRFLFTCPQGVPRDGIEFANVYQCGWFPLTYDFEGAEIGNVPVKAGVVKEIALKPEGVFSKLLLKGCQKGCH